VTARAILAAIRRAGGDLVISEAGKLRVVGRDRVPDEIVAAAKAHVADLRALFQEHVEAPSASDAVLAAQRLLRAGKWPPASAPCPFPIGPPGSDCQRCGASYLEHVAPRTNGGSR